MIDKGEITAVKGPVIDVKFKKDHLPKIREALKVKVGDEIRVMEVSQHIGYDSVRCIMLAESEGLHRGMPVIREGYGIQVPVGQNTLGRIFNVLGISIEMHHRLQNNLLL